MEWKIESWIARLSVLIIDHVEKLMMTTRALFQRSFVLALIALPVFAQAPAAASPAFDAVSIKPNKSGGGVSIHNDKDRYFATNLSLKYLIQYAYGLQSQEQILELPAWANSANFDIDARIDAETLATFKDASDEVNNHLRQKMMGSMLADRFQLKVHPETREMQVYDLEIAKGGSKLKQTDPAEHGEGNMSVNNRNITATAISVSGLCIALSGRLHREVVDKTGLTGKFDFTLQWSPDDSAGETPDATGANQLPSIFTAMQEQLGLKLDSTKGPVDTIVVDKVEMPSEN